MRKVFCECLGLELKLPDKCERIISFSPAVTESLFMMGLGEKIVGVSVYCVRPKEARKKTIIGSYSNTNIERIKSLKPDIIFTTTGYQREFAIKLSKYFPVYSIPLPLTITSLISTCAEVGYVAGYYEEARKLENELISYLLNIRPINKKLKVYVEIDLGGPVSFGAFSYITNSLEYLGVKNIFSEEACEWLIPDFEKIKKEDPDVIIYEGKMFRQETKEEILKKLKNRGWENLKAIRNDNLFLTPPPYDFLAHHGPSFILEALPWLQNILKKVY